MVLELFAYGDESGSIADPFCTVAGFVASERQWKVFCSRWRDALDRAGIRSFHAVEFFQRVSWRSSRSPYHGWSEAAGMAFQRELLKVFFLQYQRLNAANGAVNVDDFKSMSKDWQRIFTGAAVKWNVRAGKFSAKISGTGKPSAPWFTSFIDFVQHALTHVPDGAVMHLVFDQQTQYAPYAHITWGNMKKLKMMSWRKMGDLTFREDERCEPLQLADMYAYLINHWASRVDAGISPDRAEALAVLTRKAGKVYIHTGASLEQRAVEITEAVLKQIESYYGRSGSSDPDR
jgi:hypothetical protein